MATAAFRTGVVLLLVGVQGCVLRSPEQPSPRVPAACYSTSRQLFDAAFRASAIHGPEVVAWARGYKVAFAAFDSTALIAALSNALRVDSLLVSAGLARVVAAPDLGYSEESRHQAAMAYGALAIDPSFVLHVVGQSTIGELGRGAALVAVRRHGANAEVRNTAFAFACDAAWTLRNYLEDTDQLRAHLYPLDLYIALQVLPAALPLLGDEQRASLAPILDAASRAGLIDEFGPHVVGRMTVQGRGP